MKKTIIMILAIVLLCSTACIGSTNGHEPAAASADGEAAATPTPGEMPPADARTAIDLDDKANYWLEIDGVRYAIGDPYSKLAEKHETVLSGVENNVEPGYSSSVKLRNESGGVFDVVLTNDSGEDRPAKECTLASIKLSKTLGRGIAFSGPGGISFDSTKGDVERIFGMGFEASAALGNTIYAYQTDSGNRYVFWFSTKDDKIGLVEFAYFQ